MNELFTIDEFIMIGLILFSSFWIFLFNYRQDHKEKYAGNIWAIGLDLIINMGMTVGLFPVTGLPAPFLSYGGTFFLTCSIIIGIINNNITNNI